MVRARFYFRVKVRCLGVRAGARLGPGLGLGLCRGLGSRVRVIWAWDLCWQGGSPRLQKSNGRIFPELEDTHKTATNTVYAHILYKHTPAPYRVGYLVGRLSNNPPS